MKDTAAAQIARGYVPVLGMLGSMLVGYLYFVHARDPLGRMHAFGAVLFVGPMFVASLLGRALAPRG